MTRSPRPRWDVVDGRGARVAFVSHCLLNPNVRYPGGATCAGPRPDVVARYVDRGIGICQMPCPEQRAWGGARKRHLVGLYGRRLLRSRTVRRVAVGVGTTWTRVVYRVIARRVAGDIAGCHEDGLEVVEVVGVGASPSCGVVTTLDLDGALAAMARGEAGHDRRRANREVVAANVVAGRGLFIDCLDRALRSRGLTVAYREHDLIAELNDAGALDP